MHLILVFISNINLIQALRNGVLLLCLISINLSFSQQQRIIQYTSEDGLASNHIYYIIQDSKGFIWINTDNGVSRFDGKEFKNFDSTNGLPGRDVVGICEDNIGRIWLSCFNGAVCYIKDGEIFTSQEDEALIAIENNGDTYSKFVRFQDKLIITRDALGNGFEVDGDGHVRRLPKDFLPGMYASLGSYLLRYVDGNYSNFTLIDQGYHQLDTLVLSEKEHLRGRIVSASVISTNEFVLSTNINRLYRYRIEDNQICLRDSMDTSFSIDRLYRFNGKQWASHQGNQICAIDDSLRINCENGINLEQTGVVVFFIDREGNTWGGSLGNGLFFLPKNNFRYHLNDNRSSNDYPKKLASHDDKIYVAYNQGRIKEIHGRTYRDAFDEYLPRYSGIPNLMVNKEFIVAGMEYEKDIELIVLKNLETHILHITNIKFLRHWEQNSYIIGNSSRCFGVQFPNIITDTIFYSRTTAGCAVDSNKVLIGTLQGLHVCEKNDQGVWFSDSTATFPLLKNYSFSSIDRKEDIIAVNTTEKGLLLLQNGEMRQIFFDGKKINGHATIFDKDGNIWVRSYSGIYQIILKNNGCEYLVRNIRKFNGLLSDYVSDMVIIEDSVYALSPEGLSVFSRETWDLTDELPNLYLNEVIVNGKRYTTTNDILELPYDSNSISFHLSAIDFKSAGNVRFKYRIHPDPSSWQHTFSSPIKLEALGSGNYTFEAIAMNANNQWSESISFKFTICPPWWRSRWFLILSSFFIIVAVVLLVQKIISDRHRKNLESFLLKKKMTEIELKAIKAQINPHFLFNSLNSIQYFINAGRNETADSYLVKLSRLLRATLDFSSRVEIGVEEEIDFIRNYLSLESIRSDLKFSYTIDCEPEPEVYHVRMPSMVLQVHVENAIRHGLQRKQSGERILNIRFNLKGKKLICEIQDNGVGRLHSNGLKKSISNRHLSKGTELSQSKLKMYEQLTGHKSTIEIIDLYQTDGKTPDGTLVRMSINYQ